MKTKVICIALLSLSTLLCFSQTDEKWLDKAMESLSTGDCEAAQSFYNVYKKTTGSSKASVQTLIDNCKAEKLKQSSKKKSKIDLMDNSYCHANKNRYVAWNIAGTGYPWNLVTGIEFRGGGIVGVGLYGDIGMDFTAITVNYTGTDVRAHTTKTTFRYAGGIKFYPYKGLFLDCGYGTISQPSAKVLSYKYYGDHLSADEATAIREKVENSSHGILFHAGYNLVTNLSDGAGFFLGVSGGASYDVINKVFAPSVNLKIGVAWGWHR